MTSLTTRYKGGYIHFTDNAGSSELGKVAPIRAQMPEDSKMLPFKTEAGAKRAITQCAKAVQLINMLHGYKVAALWSSTDENGEPLDHDYDLTDIDEKTHAAMLADCGDFLNANYRALQAYATQREAHGLNGWNVWECAGHDFWLSRNRHGAGFFDRNQVNKVTRDKLQSAAGVYGGIDLYITDDGKVSA